MKIFLVPALLASGALAATATPAFTAGGNPPPSVVGTVHVAPAPAPCITLGASAVDFGTRGLSDPGSTGWLMASASPIGVTSCSTASENLSLAASNASTASGGTWTTYYYAGIPLNMCSVGLNRYAPFYWLTTPTGNILGGLDNTPRQIAHKFVAGEAQQATFWIHMPCRGSVGAGETVTMTFSFLAVLA